MFPGLDLYHAAPAQHIIAADIGHLDHIDRIDHIDELDRDLSNVSMYDTCEIYFYPIEIGHGIGHLSVREVPVVSRS